MNHWMILKIICNDLFIRYTYIPSITANDIEILPATFNHIQELKNLEFHHRDPFDRLLIAQAAVEKMPIVSVDAVFDAYSITRL